MAKLKTIDDFKVSRSLLGRKLVLNFKCPNCDASLKVGEDELKPVDTCPNCLQQFGIPARAIDRIQRLASHRDAESEMTASEAELLRQQKEERQKLRDEAADKCRVCGSKRSLLHALTKQDDGTFLCWKHVRSNADNDSDPTPDLKLPAPILQKRPPKIPPGVPLPQQNVRSYWVLSLWCLLLRIGGKIVVVIGVAFALFGVAMAADNQGMAVLAWGLFLSLSSIAAIVTASVIEMAINVANDLERILHLQEARLGADQE